MARRVVITGTGMVCPVGNTVEDSWNALINGQSGIDVIDEWKDGEWAGSKLKTFIGGQVKNFDAKEWVVPVKDVRRMDRFQHMSLAATHQAWTQAGLPEKLEDDVGDRAGCIIGVGLGGFQSLWDAHEALLHKGPKRVSPFFIPAVISNLAPGHAAIRYNLRNANWTPTSACTSGTHGVGEAFAHIREGRADLMVAGGAESCMHPLCVAGFNSMHALSTNNDDPKGASRPFDKDRDGFVMGEGAGIVILEEMERAKARGATIIAEVAGYGSSGDANHITAPAPEGEGAQRAMKQALDSAGMNPEEVGYVNAHGTSTAFNDKTETQAIKKIFGDHAKNMMVSSTKSMTGHLLGAAGGIEAVITALALSRNVIPPTLNYQTPDPDCDLDYVPNEAREVQVNAAISNSFGFGGTNGVLLLKRFEG
jgi:3-oxoacyl-[acyl-carrier-protein] synthase II